ncbi:ion channel [Nonomuraea sp. NPDC003214]
MDRLTLWERRTGPALLAIGVCFLASWALPVVVPALPPGADRVLWYVQVAAWALFALDYAVRLALAPRRLRFVVRNVPALVVVLLPMLRPLWLLRALLLLQVVAARVRLPLRVRAVVYVSGTALFLALVGSVAVLDIERSHADGNIKTIGDALWWALTTMTTVGYGDRFPVTPEGRLVAAGLMTAGIALLGVVTAAIASWFVERFQASAAAERRSEAELKQALEELAGMRRELGELRQAVGELGRLREELAALTERLGDR